MRIAVAGEFLGHDAFALQGKTGWFKYFEAVSITNPDTILTLLPLIGIVDIALALLLLIGWPKTPREWLFPKIRAFDA